MAREMEDLQPLGLDTVRPTAAIHRWLYIAALDRPPPNCYATRRYCPEGLAALPLRTVASRSRDDKFDNG